MLLPRGFAVRENDLMLRFLDFILAFFGLLASLPFLCIVCFISFVDTGSPLFRQVRVGRYKKPFVLVKFRTMRQGTLSVATHLVSPSAVTRFGSFLRKSKIDELPQLWNVLKGEMSLVGPRPCLYSQIELIAERDARKVFEVRPGVTGLAQTQGIDMSTPSLLAETDAFMIRDLGISSYFRYLVRTVLGSGRGDRVRD